MKIFWSNRFGLKLPGVFLVLMSVLNVFGASGDVDTGFNPQLTMDLTDNYPGAPVIQPDGKIIVFGHHQLPGGFSLRPYIKRFNADGSLDPTFNCPECLSFFPKGIAFQPDGKIVVGGSSQFNSGPGRIIRVNQNGSLDNSFRSPFDHTATNIIVQPDGKILVKCVDILANGDNQYSVRRLNNNGSLDTTFAAIVLPTNFPPQQIAQLVLLPDGKILMGGGFGGSNLGWLERHNSDGSIDNSFQANPNGGIVGIAVLSDGNYLIAGGFSAVNGTPRSRIARLFTNGSVNPSFSASIASNEFLTGLKALPNGQFYIRLYIDSFPVPGQFIGRFVRYNADGSVDNSFGQTFLQPGNWAVDDLNRIVTLRGSYYRLNTDGNIDATFNPLMSVDGYNNTAALQTDGKVVIAGEFRKTNGTNTVRFTRVNSDGTSDASFNTGSGFDVPPTTIAIQPDGKILASGNFTIYNGTPRTRLVRINADGSLDAAFNPSLDSNVFAIAALATGKVLIGGNFTTVNGTTRVAFARLNSDGSLDAALTSILGSPSTVYSILAQSDGKIMVGGSLTAAHELVRLNSDGTLDGSFNEGGVSNVGQVLQLPDGKYIVYTKNIGGNTPSRILRLYNHGPIDFSFQSPSGIGIVNAIFLQPNGYIVFGGGFGTVNGRVSRHIGRIGPSGQSDIYFPEFGANDSVNTILGQPDGKIIFVGNFSGIEDVGRSGIARLTLSNRIRGTLFDYDGDGRADISVFRPSTNFWYEMLSSNGSVGIQNFGASGDIAAPADYDGDGRTDLGLFRPSTGEWLYVSSSNNTVTQWTWGQAGDVPLPSDVNGDGKAELVVYRPSTGAWFRTEGGFVNFGASGDKPLIGDFDGDGRNDPAVFRPSTGVWWYWASSAGGEHRAWQWGSSTDIPAPGDYDGDGKTDYAVYRPSTGVWYIYYSGDGSYSFTNFGIAEDKPVPADYDGDGKADIAVFRPSTGNWYLLQTSAGFGATHWGVETDIPTENAFIP